MIYQVLVVPRIDGFSSEIGTVEVRVGSNAPSSSSRPNQNGNPVCGTTPLTPSGGVYTAFLATCNLYGRYVSVQRYGVTGYLTVCEVQVGCHRLRQTTLTGPMTMTIPMPGSGLSAAPIPMNRWHTCSFMQTSTTMFLGWFTMYIPVMKHLQFRQTAGRSRAKQSIH